MLAPGGWLLCFFHHDRRERDAIEEEIARTAELEVCWRGQSGPDFPEPDPARALRVTAFERVGPSR
jgi:hypothetical protein